MDRHRSGSAAREESRGRTTTRNKENSLADQAYLVQNENEVLRMKYPCTHPGTRNSTSPSASCS